MTKICKTCLLDKVEGNFYPGNLVCKTCQSRTESKRQLKIWQNSEKATTSVCCHCCKEKPGDQFWKGNKTNGCAPRCIECSKLYSSYYVVDAKMALLYNARNRAKTKGVPFDLTTDDFDMTETCPALGIPMFRLPGKGQSDNSPSLDRIDPSKGYISGNVAVISRRANRIKNNASVDELKRIAKWLETQTK
tara:strand:+ start:61 stop:633 length:573 start_codon:yes stop_codon:yes gene_type:complete